MSNEPMSIQCPVCDANHTIQNLELEACTVECDFEVCTRCGSTFAVLWDDPDIFAAKLEWVKSINA